LDGEIWTIGLSFAAQGQSKLKKQALQQPQLGAGRLLEMKTKKVVGTAMSQNPAKTQIRVFDGTVSVGK